MLHRGSARWTGTAGISLLEVLMGMTFLTFTVVTVGLSVMTARAASRDIGEKLLVQTQAQDFMDLLLSLPFGDASDPDPTSDQLVELFDDDDDPGGITLSQVSRYSASEPGRVFTLAGFTVEGEWSVQVDEDLEDEEYCCDSQLCKKLSTQHSHGLSATVATVDEIVSLITRLRGSTSSSELESSGEIYRIRIYFDDRLILRSSRAKERAS